MSTLILPALVLALLPLVYYLLSLCCVISFFRRLHCAKGGTEQFKPPISILKPVRGLDREAYENFASFCRLEYPEYEILFAVADTRDEVLPVIEKLRADFPQRSIRVITDVPRIGANDKINNLCQLVRNARYDFVVMSDSDVRVEPDYLAQVTRPFADPEVGAVSAFYRCVGGGSLAADLEALGMYLDSVPAALAACWVEGKMRFAFGWTLATTKRHLVEIGGLEAIANHHSDDFELGNRIARRGYRIELMQKPVTMVYPKETFRQFLRHELRWSIGLKNVRPLGYFGLIFTHGLPLSMLAAAVAVTMGRAGLAASILVAYLLMRLGLLWTTAVWGLRDRQVLRKMWLTPLRDAISFSVWFVGFFSNTIRWRGLAYRVKKGRLLPIRAEHSVGHGMSVGD